MIPVKNERGSAYNNFMEFKNTYPKAYLSKIIIPIEPTIPLRIRFFKGAFLGLKGKNLAHKKAPFIKPKD